NSKIRRKEGRKFWSRSRSERRILFRSGSPIRRRRKIRGGGFCLNGVKTAAAAGQRGRVKAEKGVSLGEMAKKLTLWHTRTFRPIFTHEELEPIMVAAGFLPLPVMEAPPPLSRGGGTAAWREYAYRAEAAAAPEEMMPRPRLPFPRIDGLHLMAYKAFFAALEFYLGVHHVSNLFHVRTMSLTKAQDRAVDRTYRPMRECEMGEEGMFVYRDGTLDNFTKMICNNDEEDGSIISKSSEKCLKKTNSDDNSNNPANLINFVEWKDLLPDY
ncbi:uncharacterized protein LOC103711603, partial [Phoenix dactylifera]|uniref:Uncharacterized protein LOC103711603 n=1 Tax=Phoenix dactylifera TaxID=42345 RepID=A0A8B8J730_PHODC